MGRNKESFAGGRETMRVESALNCGREGITAHGQAISVIGDNIANTNTAGFKTSRAEFSDLLAEGQDGRQSETLPMGGSGSTLSEVRVIFEAGVIESTGRTLDAGIDGGGFFIVGDPADPKYSRAGNFSIDSEGLLVNSDGEPVLGLAPGGSELAALNMYGVNAGGAATTQASVIGNLNAADNITTVPTNPQSFREIGETATYGNTVGVYDSLGQRHEVTVQYYKTGANTWVVQAYVDGGEVGGTAGVPVQLGQNTTLTFDSSGAITADNQAAAVLAAQPAWSNGAAAGSFNLNFGGFTQFASPSTLSNVTQDGTGVGSISGYEIMTDGQVVAKYDTGTTLLIGTIQLADFTNKDGLVRAGSTAFRATEDAGTRTTGNPGIGTLGKLQGGALERSTVDISTQFVDMILFQRGYQANSQTINAANQLIRDTIQLVR